MGSISIAATYRALSQSAFPRLAFPRARSHRSQCSRSRQTRSPEGMQAMNIAIKQPMISNRQAPIGKVSLVTGSTGGSGLGFARARAAAGSRIVLNGFGKTDEVARVQAELAAEFNVDVSYSGADMSKPAAIREMIEQTLDAAGRLDVLVNNAGIQHVAPLQDFPPEKWDAILAINLSSAFHTMRLARPSMLRNKWAASSMSPPRTGWSPRRSSRPMSPPNTASSASLKWSRSRLPSRGSPATRSAPAMSTRRWSRRRSKARHGRMAFLASKSS